MNCSIGEAMQKLIIYLYFPLQPFLTTAWNHSFLLLDEIWGTCHRFSQSFQSSEHSYLIVWKILCNIRSKLILVIQCRIPPLPAGKLQWQRGTIGWPRRSLRFSVTSYRKSWMNFLADPIFCNSLFHSLFPLSIYFSNPSQIGFRTQSYGPGRVIISGLCPLGNRYKVVFFSVIGFFHTLDVTLWGEPAPASRILVTHFLQVLGFLWFISLLEPFCILK